ncbi:MAG: hypothetical protein LBS54_01785 [Dysgonamonadaceae bacterium]|jgi:hypothetical protein|nr:hypothetical protein [Dysgonamonadaceae bacterium]
MKKLKTVLTAFIALFILSTTYTVQAQGIYSRKDSPVTAAEKKKLPGIWAAPPSGKNEGVPATGNNAPIGDGLSILVMLAGGYFLSKKLKNKDK